MKKIIVAVDASQHAMKAVEKAKEIVEAFSSDVILINVVEGLHYYDYEIGSMLSDGLEKVESSKARAGQLLEETKKSFSLLSDNVETVLLEGDVSKMLIDYIDKSDADLVVIGSHGMKGLRKLKLGDVVGKVIHHINKSIMIVR